MKKVTELYKWPDGSLSTEPVPLPEAPEFPITNFELAKAAAVIALANGSTNACFGHYSMGWMAEACAFGTIGAIAIKTFIKSKILAESKTALAIQTDIMQQHYKCAAMMARPAKRSAQI